METQAKTKPKTYDAESARRWAKRQGWTRESAVAGGWDALAARLNKKTQT